jgi:S1-C subfamily serine protease
MSNLSRTKATQICSIPPVILFSLAILWHPSFGSGLTEEELNTVEVYERVAPSIVNITTEACEPDYFLCVVPERGSGSGIVLTEDGIIVTNHHVIAEAKNIQVSLGNGRHFMAEVVGAAPQHDVAVLRIDTGGTPVFPVVLGDSDRVRVGEKVLAIGNPFGLGQTLTVGIVSMTGRNIRHRGVIMRNLIQTDAAINPGNSGGALVNSRGELIGMNTMIFSPTGSSIGIGFSIPVNQIRKVAPGIIHTWGRWVGWVLAILIVTWIIRSIYSPRRGGRGMR